MNITQFDRFLKDIFEELPAEQVDTGKDDTIKVLLPGVKQVELYYLPNESAVEIETGDSLIEKYKDTTLKVKLPPNKRPASAKLDSGILFITLKSDVKSEKIEVEVH